MADENPIIVYGGAYDNAEDAELDFAVIKAAHHDGLIGKYQSALFTKEADGTVKVLNTDSTTRVTGAKWGAATGAVVGLLFPPTLIAGLFWGTGIGTLVGHLAKGWGHKDVKELGDVLETGQSGVVLVAEATPDVAAEKLLKNATKLAHKQVDEESDALRAALDEWATIDE